MTDLRDSRKIFSKSPGNPIVPLLKSVRYLREFFSFIFWGGSFVFKLEKSCTHLFSLPLEIINTQRHLIFVEDLLSRSNEVQMEGN